MDKIFFSTIIVLALSVAAFYYPKKWFVVSAKPGSEKYFIAFAHVLQLLQMAIAIFLLVGIVGMAIQVKTILWFFWQAIYLPSVGIVFFVCPVLNLIASAWGVTGCLRLKYGPQAIVIVTMLVLTLAINFGLIYYFENPDVPVLPE